MKEVIKAIEEPKKKEETLEEQKKALVNLMTVIMLELNKPTEEEVMKTYKLCTKLMTIKKCF